MKDNTSGKDRTNHADGRRPSDGQEYTNPDGSHGYVYYPDYTLAERKSRRYRGAVIVLSVILVAILLSVCCFVGVYMASQVPETPRTPVEEQETETALGTSGGLVIGVDGETEQMEESESAAVMVEVTLPAQPVETDPLAADKEPEETAPPSASIDKRPPQREDQNGDSLPEIETDENGQVITSAGKNPLTVATVVNRVAASVVEITTEASVQSDDVGRYVISGAGSGVIVSKKGYIVTNYRVIEGASVISVRLNNGKAFSAKLVGVDAQTDIAVLRIDAADHELTVATLGSSFDLVVGESVLAIGNPSGSLSPTVAESMVTATSRQINVGGSVLSLLQISDPVNPANAGCGLFNLAGELVGIANAGITDPENENAGFAIPVDTAYEIVKAIIDRGEMQSRPALGFEVLEVTSYQISMEYFDSFYVGVFVIDRNHEAVKYGDLILTVDGVKINTAAELHELISGKSVGDTMEFVVYRERAKHTVTVTVGEERP